MRHSRWTNLAVALTLFVGSSMLYPAAAQSMCGEQVQTIYYWDSPDVNGNCPQIGYHYDLVGSWSQDCDGNITEWGFQGGCDFEIFNTFCPPCQPQ